MSNMKLPLLKQVRQSKGISVATLAKAAGMTPGRIYQLEDGGPKQSTTLSTAIVLALLLGVNVCDLTGEANPGDGAEIAHVRPLIQKGA